MFKWLSRGARGDKPEPRVSHDHVADAVIELGSSGRLSEELLDGGATPDPAPEYIQEATEPSAEAWEREREARRQIEQERGES